MGAVAGMERGVLFIALAQFLEFALEKFYRVEAFFDFVVVRFDFQNFSEEVVGAVEMFVVEVADAQVTEYQGIAGAEVQGSFQYDQSLLSFAGMENRPAQAAQDFRVVGLNAVGCFQMFDGISPAAQGGVGEADQIVGVGGGGVESKGLDQRAFGFFIFAHAQEIVADFLVGGLDVQIVA